MNKSTLEFITNMILVVSGTYWINSILTLGFGSEPISIIVGTMIIIVLLFIRNLNVKSIDEISFKLFRNEQTKEGYKVFILLMIGLDILFLLINLIV